MNMEQLTLGFGEKVTFSLRALYNRYGYTQYKMGKFEEYDLYARNKDFLFSDSVITFTDVDGKLLALKPDVTLSIVKNSKDAPDTVQKLYYNENVYRVTKGARSFREMMQVGLECLGNIDDYTIAEVLLLAAESLRSISPDCILDISHLGLLSQVMDSIGLPKPSRDAVVACIGEKNAHELTRICRDAGISDENIRILTTLLTLHGTPEQVLPQLEALLAPCVDSQMLRRFVEILKVLGESPVAEVLRIDFSVVDDIHYYNGFVFKGFISGIPSSVLSGGQYDKLMKKMNRKSGAIGFAVYLDQLARLEQTGEAFDVDAVLLYDENAALSQVSRQVKSLTDSGIRVLAAKQRPENIRCKKVLILRGSEVETLENNA